MDMLQLETIRTPLEKFRKNAEKLAALLKEKEEQIEQKLEVWGDNIEDLPVDFIVSPMRKDQLISTEVCLWKCSEALAALYKATGTALPQGNSEKIKEPQESPKELVSMWQFPDLVIVRSPFLRKRDRGTRAALGCGTFFEPLTHRLYSINCEMFFSDKVYLYVLNVYRKETNHDAVIDPDNIDFKAIGDIVMQRLRIDDNGSNVSIIIHTAFGDGLPPGSYTVVVPRADKILTAKGLYEFVKARIVECKNESDK